MPLMFWNNLRPAHFCALIFLVALFQLSSNLMLLKTNCVVPPTPRNLNANHSLDVNTSSFRRERPETQINLLEIVDIQPIEVNFGDFIFSKSDWDGAPVVIEKFNLIFFTSAKVGCTTWKQLFRRIMGIKNWSVEDYKTLIPWNPELNGLKYLYHYNREKATEMMTSPNWTRAIFVREPKERFLSAYIDKVITTPSFLRSKCCSYTGKCMDQAKSSLSGFLHIIYTCDNAHWRPQWKRMEEKYWPYINFVGRMETIQKDAERLLKKVGAWDMYGKSGWGTNGKDSIFQAKAGGVGRHHATNAKNKLKSYFTPELEMLVENFYAGDYEHSILNFTKIKIFE